MRTLTRLPSGIGPATGAIIIDSRTGSAWTYTDYSAAEREMLFGSFIDEEV